MFKQCANFLKSGTLVIASTSLFSSDLLAGEHRPVLSPDGSSVVFMSQAENDDWDLFIMQPDGTARRQLTNRRGWDGYAVWSPDQDHIVFDQGDPTDDSKKQPTILDLTTGATRQLGEYIGWLSVNDWHGDNLLAFWEREGQRDLFLLDADGNIVRQLTNTPDQSEHDAHFSPDGTKVVFASGPREGSGKTTLETLDLTSGSRRLLKDSVGRIYGIDWSPDGQFIAFTDAPGGEDDDADVYLYDLKNSDVTQCVDNDAWDHMPVWTPDGKSVLFTSYRTGNERIYWTDCASSTLRLWLGSGSAK